MRANQPYPLARVGMPTTVFCNTVHSNEKTIAEPIGAGVPIENDSKGSAVSSAIKNSITRTCRKDNEKFSLKDSMIWQSFDNAKNEVADNLENHVM